MGGYSWAEPVMFIFPVCFRFSLITQFVKGFIRGGPLTGTGLFRLLHTANLANTQPN